MTLHLYLNVAVVALSKIIFCLCRFFIMETQNRKVTILSTSMLSVLAPSSTWSLKMKYGFLMLLLLLVRCTVSRSIWLLISVRGLLNLRTQPVWSSLQLIHTGMAAYGLRLHSNNLLLSFLHHVTDTVCRIHATLI